ncbi:hypothetical protein CPAR01_00053 [Colletotrichum paranaense]|uniref:Uncharacterized protein n=2 Tax=Colletotrichum acutatum species complex TaxID=2707335 RepID=A0AAI9XGT6_9PEZI|nr:uncharacterized protein CPAR01_00053 [Colletotrichum paranaense]KAK1448983.1 hypothetical protein CMEL01_08298 [Colletotrichum melonis]KAK1546086.1 hypothetical protein CPAR01_00053 [Colletotrichum paranaense]
MPYASLDPSVGAIPAPLQPAMSYREASCWNWEPLSSLKILGLLSLWQSPYGLPLLVLTLISSFHPKDLIPVSSPTFPCSSSSPSRRHVKLLSYRSPAASIQFGPQRSGIVCNGEPPSALNRWKIRTTQPYQRLGPAIPCNLTEPPNSILSVHDNSAMASQQV